MMSVSIPKQKSVYIPALYSLKQLNKMSENMSIGNTLEIPEDQFKKEYIEECTENKLVLEDGQFKKEYLEGCVDNKLVLGNEKKTLSCTDVKGLLLPYGEFKEEYVDELLLTGNPQNLKKIQMSKYDCYDIDEDLDIKSFDLEEKKKEVRKLSNKVPTTTKINILVPIKKDKNLAIPNYTKSPESIDDKDLAQNNILLTNPKVRDSLVLGNDMKINTEIMIGHLQKELLKEVEQVEQKMKSLIKKDNQITELNKKVKTLTEENNRIAELQKINEKKSENIKREDLSTVQNILQSEKDKAIELTNENHKLQELNDSYNDKNNYLVTKLEIIMKEKEQLAEENKCLLSEKWVKEDEIYDLTKRNDHLIEADANNVSTINALRSKLDNILKEKEEQTKKRKMKETKKRNKKDKKIFLLESIVSKMKLRLLRKKEINMKLQNKVDELEKTTDEKTKKYENLLSVLHNEEKKASELSELNQNYGLKVDTLKAELVEEQIKFRKENEIKENRQKILIKKCEEQNKELETILKGKEELLEQNKIKENRQKILIEKCEEQTTQIKELQNLLRCEKDKILDTRCLNDKINSMRSELETILKEKEELLEKNKCLGSDVSIKENEICDTKKRYDNLLKEDSNHFMSTISKIKLSLLKENELNNKLQYKVDEFKKTNDETTKNFEELQSVLYSEEKKVSGLERKVTELSNINIKLSALNQNFGSEIDILKVQLAEEKMNNWSAKRQLEILYKEKDVFVEENQQSLADDCDEESYKDSENKEDESFQIVEIPNESNDQPTTSKSSKNSSPENMHIPNDMRNKLSGDLILTSATRNEEANSLSSETKANALSSEIEANPLSSETKANVLSSETKANALASETKGNVLSSKTKGNALSSEIEADPLSSETEANALPSETKANALPSETKANALSSETKSNSLSSETKANVLPSETKANALSSVTKSNSLPSETKLTENNFDLKTSNCLSINDTPPRQREIAEKKPIAMPRKIYVGGLPVNGMLTQADIGHHFSQYGTVLEVIWPFNHFKNTPKNFCFVGFDSERINETLIEKGSCTIEGRFGFLYPVEIKSSHY